MARRSGEDDTILFVHTNVVSSVFQSFFIIFKFVRVFYVLRMMDFLAETKSDGKENAESAISSFDGESNHLRVISLCTRTFIEALEFRDDNVNKIIW